MNWFFCMYFRPLPRLGSWIFCLILTRIRRDWTSRSISLMLAACLITLQILSRNFLGAPAVWILEAFWARFEQSHSKNKKVNWFMQLKGTPEFYLNGQMQAGVWLSATSHVLLAPWVFIFLLVDLLMLSRVLTGDWPYFWQLKNTWTWMFSYKEPNNLTFLLSVSKMYELTELAEWWSLNWAALKKIAGQPKVWNLFDPTTVV